jgi:hypothetical protein
MWRRAFGPQVPESPKDTSSNHLNLQHHRYENLPNLPKLCFTICAVAVFNLQHRVSLMGQTEGSEHSGYKVTQPKWNFLCRFWTLNVLLFPVFYFIRGWKWWILLSSDVWYFVACKNITDISEANMTCWRRQQGPLKLWCTSTKLHGVIRQKTNFHVYLLKRP